MSTPHNRGAYRPWKRSWHGNRGSGCKYQRRSQTVSHCQSSRKSIAACPYNNWNEYLKDDPYIPDSVLANKVNIFHKYFKENVQQFDKEDIENKQEVILDYQALTGDTTLFERFPSLKTDLHNDPKRMLAAIALTLHQVLTDDQFSGSSCTVFDVSYLHLRLINYGPTTPLKHLKANSFGKLVAVHGTVVRVSNIKPFVTKMAFSCNSCNETQVMHLTDGKYTIPTKCTSYDCRGRSFTPQRSSSDTETIDWQNIKIQEIISDDQRESGRIPRTVECELTANLVDSCVPGDMITCTGIVQVSSSEENVGSKNKDKSMYLLYLHAVSVSNSKQTTDKDAATSIDNGSSEFTMKELYAIQEIQSEKDLFRLIVGSICPTIYGHALVKAGLVLALFGGSRKFTDDKNYIPVRGDPHVLIVGDPGLGKSQMLQAVANVAPRGVYVCGNTTTTSGLTVTLSKESGSGNYSLEAGALVLGDRGCCCIDEFDKMGNQHQALLEAMEQQSISIAKAGILCSLPARTSILAAANPIGGHYNRAKTVSENLKMNGALLSRFDLVFILVDKPDEEMDNILSRHVVSLHSEETKGLEKFNSVTVERPTSSKADCSFEQWKQDRPLADRLKVGRGVIFDALPAALLRKYIQYARKYVHPTISSEAAKILQEFYLDLRKQSQGPNCTPITTRQLEALIRLTEARARLELREKANAQDAADVIEIMRNSLIDTYIDELDELDYSRSQNGSGISKRAQVKKFISQLNLVSERQKNSLFNKDQLFKIARQLKLETSDFEDFICTLNAQNYLLKKGAGLYQLQTSSCL